MEETVTSTINHFWQNIPAAAYVLLGVIISGLFTIFSSWLNNKSNKEIKGLENKNSLNLRELENENARKLKELETESNEKLQTQNLEAQKALRLLDEKIKSFSDFHQSYSEILMSGTNAERQQRIEAMRKTTYRVLLLTPSLTTELNTLDMELKNYGNFYWALVNGKKTLTETQKDIEERSHLDKIYPLISTIFPRLTGEM